MGTSQQHPPAPQSSPTPKR